MGSHEEVRRQTPASQAEHPIKITSGEHRSGGIEVAPADKPGSNPSTPFTTLRAWSNSDTTNTS